MTSFSIHKIISFLNDYLNTHLSCFFNEPYIIMLLDENEKLVTKWGDLKIENIAFQSLINTRSAIQENNIAVYYLPIQIGINSTYYLGIGIEGDVKKANSYLKFLQALVNQSIQVFLNQQVITKNEQFTFAIMNSIHFGLIATNLTGEIIYANDNACRAINIRRRDLVNKSIKNLLHNWNSISKIVSSGNIVQNEEFIFVNKTESKKFSVNVSPINDKINNKLGYVITLRSIEKVYQLVNKYTGMQARYFFHDIIGKSKIMKQVIDYAQTISNSPSTILIEGESGTGKEIFA